MRLTGTVALVLGCLLTAAAIAVPLLRPLVCVGALSAACGLILLVTTDRVRAAPAVAANGKVRELFEEVANDPLFHLVAGLSAQPGPENAPSERDTFLQDLSTASYRYSKMVQGGYAGRDAAGNLALALSRWHLRRAAAAHELFHLARDVLFRCRGGKAGKDLNATTGILREEALVWQQTLAYLPVPGAVEIVLPVVLVCLVSLHGGYLLIRFVC
jgi:hypothetical protein